MELLFVTLALISTIGLASSNPIDGGDSSWSWLDPLGVFSDDSSSASASADASASASDLDSNKLGHRPVHHGKGKGLHTGLETGAAKSFAVGDNVHIPDITGKTDGIDASLGLAGAGSFAIDKNIDVGDAPVVIEEVPAPYYGRPGPPRPMYHGPPPPRPAPAHYQQDRHYQQERPYNYHH